MILNAVLDVYYHPLKYFPNITGTRYMYINKNIAIMKKL